LGVLFACGGVQQLVEPRIVLASASPRRARLLEQIGLAYQVWPSSVNEETTGVDNPSRLAAVLALQKAEWVARRAGRGVVLGADTVVAMGRVILGKPRDEAHAIEMLTMLSGQTHQVLTGVALVEAETGRALVEVEETLVTFRHLHQGEILAYVQSGEPADKAGGYGIQGLGAVLVERIEGCYSNVVGLPLARLTRMLQHFDIHVLAKNPP